MESKEKRQESFKDWPADACVPWAAFTETGLYYTGHGEKVRCHMCKGELEGWEEGDDPAAEHQSFYPECPLSKVPTAAASKSKGTTQPDAVMKKPPDNKAEPVIVERVANLDIGRVGRVEHPAYQDDKKRLDTFQKWHKSAILSPQVLVDAGFYFTDEGDKVRCFTCGLVLQYWEKGDNPMLEHRKWADKCPYVNAKLTGELPIQKAPMVAEQPKYLLEGKTPVQEQLRVPKKITEEVLCIKCHHRPREILFEPCAHFILCNPCAQNLDVCPLCNEMIQRKTKWRRWSDSN